MTRTRLALALFALLAPSLAQAAPPAEYDVQAAFAETDANKDGAIEVDEYYDRLVEIYFHGDGDKNGTLDGAEFTRAIVIEEDFAQVDVDADGKVTRREFVRARLSLFWTSDTDGDGALSLAEVRAALERTP